MEAATSFLFGSIAKIPFKFRGIPVGANPMRKSTWNPILDFLSFYKTPKILFKRLLRFKEIFFGEAIERDVSFVGLLEKVCMPRKEGGLGVKNIEAFILALVNKWRWRY